MLHPMLIMPSLVFGLDLFQLFLYCLVNLLDLFNEPSCLVHIVVSIIYGTLPKTKSKGDLGVKPKQVSKGDLCVEECFALL